MIFKTAVRKRKNDYWIAVFLLCIFALPAPFAHGGKYLELGWKDLVKKITYKNPLEGLSKQQLAQLSLVAQLRSLQTGKKEPDKELVENAGKAATALKADGINVDGLLAEAQEIVLKQGMAVVEGLNGKDIRLPGYALPLEYRGKKITEFLLVPWVGACIHTPPPPPNQIVYVKAEQGITNPGQYKPVWVMGRMQVKPQTKELYLVDGSAPVDTGYSLKAHKVEVFEK